MKLLYIFTGGRKQRINDILLKRAPSEFLFGAYELKKSGYDLDIIEMDEIVVNFSFSNTIINFKNRFLKKITGLHINELPFKKILNKFDQYDYIICSNDYIALSLYPLIKTKKINIPFCFFVMGQLANINNKNLSFLGRKIGKSIYKNLINSSNSLFFLGKGEFDFAKSLYPEIKNKLHLLPFAVDTNFWKPDNKIIKDDYILSIGNDKARDWEMLINIAKRMPEEKFKIITKNIKILNSLLPKNIEHIKGDWKDYFLTDNEIRDFYRKSKMVILPIKQTLQPSGQSVCLQAMSCGKPVIISDYKGFWDPNKIKNNVHLIISEHNIDSFVENIKNLNNNKEKIKKISHHARKLVKNKYNIILFTEKLIKIIHSN